MSNFIEQLERSYLIFFESLEINDEKSALSALDEIKRSIFAKAVLTTIEKERVWTLIDRIFSVSYLKMTAIKSDALQALAHYQKALNRDYHQVTQAIEPPLRQAVALPSYQYDEESNSLQMSQQISEWLDEIQEAVSANKNPVKKPNFAHDLQSLHEYVSGCFTNMAQNCYPNVLDAIESMLQLLKIDSEHLYFKLAGIYMVSDINYARRLYLRIYKNNPQSTKAVEALVEIALNQGQLMVARQYLERVTQNGIKISLLGRIEQTENEWQAMLNRLRELRSDNTKISDLSLLCSAINECKTFVHEKEIADVYAEAVLELGLLLLIYEQKHRQIRTYNQLDQGVIDVGGLERAIAYLQKALDKMPSSIDALLAHAEANLLAGKRFQAVLDNNWSIRQTVLENARSGYTYTMQQFFAQAKASFTKLMDMPGIDTTRAKWEVANLQEIAGEYRDAKATYTTLAYGSRYQSVARVKLADLSFKMKQYDDALSKYEMLIRNSRMSRPVVSKAKLYLNMAKILTEQGRKQEAIKLFQKAKACAQNAPCFDIQGLPLLFFVSPHKEYLASVRFVLGSKDSLKYLPVIVHSGKQYYFHDNIAGKIQGDATALGDLYDLLNEYGINHGEEAVLFLQNGDYSRLYAHIQMKKGLDHLVVAWKEFVVKTIDQQLQQVQSEMPNTSLVTSTNRNRFSCASVMGLDNKDSGRDVSLTALI